MSVVTVQYVAMGVGDGVGDREKIRVEVGEGVTLGVGVTEKTSGEIGSTMIDVDVILPSVYDQMVVFVEDNRRDTVVPLRRSAQQGRGAIEILPSIDAPATRK